MERNFSTNKLSFSTPMKLEPILNSVTPSKFPSNNVINFNTTKNSFSSARINKFSNRISTNPSIRNSTPEINTAVKFDFRTTSILFSPNKTKIPIFLNSHQKAPTVKIKKIPSIINFYEEDKHVSDKNTAKEDKLHYENEIKKLNYWDVENILVKNAKVKTEVAPISKIKDTESIGWMNELRLDLRKLKLDKSTLSIQKFYQKMDMDQKSIFLHNITLAKRKFNFEVFNKEKNETLNTKEVTSDNFFNKMNVELDFNKYFMITEDIKNDENYEMLLSNDFYREVIRQKLKIENRHRKEILALSHKFYEMKIEKKKIENKKAEIINAINQLRSEVHSQRENAERRMEKTVKMYGLSNYVYNEHCHEPVISSTRTNKNPIGRKFTIRISLKESDLFRAPTDKLNGINKIQDEIKFINIFYESKKEMADKKINKLSIEIEKIDIDIKVLKNNMSNHIQNQRDYYFDILRKGIDVRNEGLVWIVRILLELNSIFDVSKFPRYFDNRQIEYIINYAKKTIENNQLKVIMTVLKNRQKKARQENTDFLFKTNFSSSPDQNSDDFEQLNEGKLDRNAFSSRVFKDFNEIYKKYEDVARKSQANKLEEIHINKIIEELKTQIGLPSQEDNPLFTVEENDCKDYPTLSSGFFKYFKENEKHKEIFDEILLLREIIQRNDEELKALKNEEIKFFKKKFEAQKFSHNGGIQYEITYSALFGNGVSL